MAHPYKALLDEFKFAVDHLPPTVPAETSEEAKKTHKELLEKEDCTEGQIHEALSTVGKKEFPYRKAYHQMVGTAKDEQMAKRVLEHVEPNVKALLEKLLADGATLEEVVKSEMFETQFTGEERYQVQDGIMDAEEHIREELPKTIASRQAEYDKLVEEWRVKAKAIEEKIEELKALAPKEAKWKGEILDKARQLEDGFSVVERDPDLNEIEKEIEYWKGTLGEEV